jgi:hypothetical protein
MFYHLKLRRHSLVAQAGLVPTTRPTIFEYSIVMCYEQNLPVIYCVPNRLKPDVFCRLSHIYLSISFYYMSQKLLVWISQG